MSELTYEQLRDRIARGKLDDRYFLKGDDPFLRDEAIRLIVETHLDDLSKSFDLEQMSGEDVDAETLASALETPPVLASKRVIVLRDAERLRANARSLLEAAVEASSSGRVLVIAADVPRRSKARVYTTLTRACATVSLRSPKASELPGWLAARAREIHELELEMTAAQRLVAALGERPGALAQELDKLASYVGPRQRIILKDVEAAVGAIPQMDRWAWVDRVMERDLGTALRELPALLDGGETAVGLIIALGESLLRLGLALNGGGALVEALERDGSYRNLKWKIRIYERQARLWTQDAVDEALGHLLNADRLIKSGGLRDRVALEEALLKMQAHSRLEGRSGAGGGGVVAGRSV